MRPKYNLLKLVVAFTISAAIVAACKKSDTATQTASTTTTTTTTKPVAGLTVTEDTTTYDSAGVRWGNRRPHARAGSDQTYTTAVSEITLDGSQSYDPNGYISSYSWIKEYGPGGTITSPDAAVTTVTDLSQGEYKFTLTVTDNRGSTASDTVHISNGSNGTPPPPPNQAPDVDAGANQTITLPESSVTLSGSATDADGTIVSYLWTIVSGTGGIITSPNSASTTVTGLIAGSYVFNLEATDNGSASGNQTVSVTVNAATPPPTNQIPVVNAGSAQTITLPISLVTLSGSATDADGTIVSYLWTKVSGTGGIIVSPSSASTTVTGLIAGSYVFNLEAKDNAGASGNQTVSVTVNAATPPPPPPPASGYSLTFQSGYDQMSDITTNNGQYGNGTISTSVYNIGPGSFYSIPSSVSAGIRSEVQYNDAAQNPEEGAIEYDVMYETVVPDNGHSFQWHPNTSDGSASPGLYHINGKFCVVRWKGGTNYYQTGSLMDIQTQHWYHMRIEYKFANSNAYMRWYIDGSLYYDLPATESSWLGDGSGHYLKVGYNGWDANSVNSRIYYDNLKIWTK